MAFSLLLLLTSAFTINGDSVLPSESASLPVPAESKRRELRGARRELWGSCRAHEESCNPFNWCCGGLSCHPTDFKCYHKPRREGEPCFSLYPCRSDLTCQGFRCIDNAKILEGGTRGRCSKSESGPERVTIITYNVYLIISQVLNGIDARTREITKWFGNRASEDIVALQEVFLKYDNIRDGLSEAGYCHYVTSTRGQFGSGLAIYSKFPIVEYDFMDFYDFGDTLNPEAIADKGVMYAKIEKDGKFVHVFNTHTLSNELGEQHKARIGQYDTMRTFISDKNIPSADLVLMAGDFNENKFKTHKYKAMLKHLEAGEITVTSHKKATYDGPGNLLADSDEKQILDYVFFDSNGFIPSSSSECEVLKPVNGKGVDLSDHQPVSCNLVY